jgi:hypothetical protein
MGMCQDLFAFLKSAQPFSIASIVSSKALMVYLPHWVRKRTLFICVNSFACLASKGGMFSSSIIVRFKSSPMRYIKHHSSLLLLGPILPQLGYLAILKGVPPLKLNVNLGIHYKVIFKHCCETIFISLLL